MYTKEEVSRQKQAFWTAFGKYMQPVLSAEGMSIGWLNYKTGIAGIQFKMDADHKQVSIAILLSHRDETIRAQQYEQLQQLKALLQQELEGESWNWQEAYTDEWGKTFGMVSKVLTGVNIHRKEDWPAMISFLKQRIMALDAFWSNVKFGFEGIG